MTKDNFIKNLKQINLSKKDFANMVGFSYSSVNNWNDKSHPVPSWVDSWLENYALAKRYKVIKEMLKDM